MKPAAQMQSYNSPTWISTTQTNQEALPTKRAEKMNVTEEKGKEDMYRYTGSTPSFLLGGANLPPPPRPIFGGPTPQPIRAAGLPAGALRGAAVSADHRRRGGPQFVRQRRLPGETPGDGVIPLSVVSLF